MSKAGKLDVYFSVQPVQEEVTKNQTFVVVDVLRATSTIVTALSNGAKGIIPVGDMSEASRISQSVDSDDVLLCGEKDGIKIEGYDLGNSPLEYTREVVWGKSLILNTTNGTKAIKKSMGGKDVYIAAFLNLDAVTALLKEVDGDITIVCSGWKGRMSMEDLLLAGNLVYNLTDGEPDKHATDGAKIACAIYEKFGNDLETVILHSNHAARLKELVGTEDIIYCCQTNKTDVVPILKEGILTTGHAKEA